MKNQAHSPLVSVIMSVWQAQDTVAQALESILGQNFSHFEYLIVDDASTDSTPQILARYAAQDTRVRVFAHTQNQGLARSLNHLLRKARGQFVARMDADDLALPHRLQTQVDYLNQHPEAMACGSWVANLHKPQQVLKMPVGRTAILKAMLTSNPFIHPTIMFRRGFLQENQLFYDEGYPVAQDFELWARILPLAGMHNIPQVLLHYNRQGQGLTQARRSQQLQLTRQTRRTFLGRICPEGESLWQQAHFTTADIHRFCKQAHQPGTPCAQLQHEIRYALWRSLARYNLQSLAAFCARELAGQKGLTAQQQKKIILRHFFPARFQPLL